MHSIMTIASRLEAITISSVLAPSCDALVTSSVLVFSSNTRSYIRSV